MLKFGAVLGGNLNGAVADDSVELDSVHDRPRYRVFAQLNSFVVPTGLGQLDLQLPADSIGQALQRLQSDSGIVGIKQTVDL